VLKLGGAFLAAIASHESAEPESLVIRMSEDDRALLLDEAPDIYYVTDFYSRYRLVLVRLRQLHVDALYDLLLTSWRLTVPKGRRPQKARPASVWPRRKGTPTEDTKDADA
jgi:hypothetical protein